VSVVEVILTEGPIASVPSFRADGAGAVVAFEGVVRPREGDEPIEGLLYEVYEPMTSRELRQLASELLEETGVVAVRVEHSFGFVANGECSFLLQVAGRHREESLEFVREFIARMKRDVPIWKVPRRRGE